VVVAAVCREDSGLTHRAFKLLLAGGVSMRFHPKLHTSTDQRPDAKIAIATTDRSCQNVND
jgi:hypothetical protein